MKVVIRPSVISGTLDAPPSKSSMQRAIAAALLANGESVLMNPSFSDDSMAAIRMAECLGAKITIGEDSVSVTGGFKSGCTRLDCNESGLGVRLFSAIAALGSEPVSIYGKGSILTRPMDAGIVYLRSFGAIADSSDGLLPMVVCGPLKGATAFLDGSVSSQFLTGLLMALPLVKEDSRLIINELNSKSYIDLTLDILSRFGIGVLNENYREFHIKGNQVYNPQKYRIEGDWSGAAFLLVLGAIGGDVEVAGLQTGSTQPDRNIITYLKLAGAGIETDGTIIRVTRGDLKSFEADITDSPDLAPPLVALAAHCSGTTIIRGTARLMVKESDRGLTLESEFRKLGVDITNHGDSLVVKGGKPLIGATVSSHNDHRIAMAISIAAIRAGSEIVIDNAESVNKSYPGFYEDIKRVGANYNMIS